MSGWSQTEIKTDMEIEEEFCAIYESIKSEEQSDDDIKPATLPEKLCAMPYNDMVNIFNSFEITKNILEKIDYSLPITVKETDTLPKQICRFCLVELERCHRFRKSVAEANERLLAFEKLACIKSEEMEINNDLSPQYNTQLGSSEYDNVDGSLETNSDVEVNDNESTIIPKDARTAIHLGSCSVVLSILKTCSKDNSGTENGETSSSNTPSYTKDRSADSTTEVLDVEGQASENDEASICDSGVNTENLDDDALAHSRNQLHKCNTCAKTFKRKSTLTRHSKIHTNQGLQLHKCDKCAKTFKWKHGLTRHCKMHKNEGLQLHKCNTCAKTFKWKGNLTQHSKIHTNQGLRLHKCNTCAKMFKSKGSLTQHSKIHTGEGLYSCRYCAKAFTKKQSRDIHHHVHTNERPFKCPDCKKSFNHPATLKQHAASHSKERNYRCPLCDKSLKTSRAYNSHMKVVHLNYRPWRCAHCNKTFGRKSQLRRHLGTCKLSSE